MGIFRMMGSPSSPRLLLPLLLLVTATAHPLRIFVVPHSHEDTGWIKTVDEYYDTEVKYILDEVTTALTADPKRKFIYVEMAFLARWWSEQPSAVRLQFKKLVQSKQMVFVNGGWCMNDEAVAHYVPIINQMTLGHSFISSTFGPEFVHRSAWSIDPFGSSITSARLWSLTQFEGFVIDRIDYRTKAALAAKRAQDFLWSFEDNRTMLTHILDSFYGTPAGFDFEFDAPPVVKVPSSPFTTPNISLRAAEYVQLAAARAQGFPTPNVLIPYGGDFNYQNAHKKFRDFDLLIEEINEHSAGDKYNGTTIMYSTLDDYFAAVRNDVGRGVLQTWKSDFFPNAYPSNWGAEHDENDSYWTGFFSSRPASKALSRRTDAILHAAEVVFALYAASGKLPPQSISIQNSRLVAMREAQALFQHHDAVTGTEKQFVLDDYVARLQSGQVQAEAVLSDIIGQSDHESSGQWHDKASPSTPKSVSVFNPTGWVRSSIISLIGLKYKCVVVSDSASGQIVQSQTSPSFDKNGAMIKGVFDLHFQASDVPALGNKVYTFRPNSSCNAEHIQQPKGEPFSISNEWRHLMFKGDGSLQSVTDVVSNVTTPVTVQFLSYVPFSAPAAHHTDKNGLSVQDGEPQQTSGAYIFRPSPDVGPFDMGPPTSVIVIDGPVVACVHLKWSGSTDTNNSTEAQPILQVVRLFKGLSQSEGTMVELSTAVGPIAIANGGREITMKVHAPSVQSQGLFATDANGMDLIQRRRLPKRGRGNDSDTGVAIAGNFYPATSLITTRDDEQQMTLVTDQSHGATSLEDGSLEIMLHRRLLHDDDRGVGEALNETTIARSVTWLLLSRPDTAAIQYRRAAVALQRPLETVFATDKASASQIQDENKQVTTGMTELPFGAHLLTMQSFDSLENRISTSEDTSSSYGRMAVRLQNIFQKGEGAKDPIQVSLSALFASSLPAPSLIEEFSLTLAHRISSWSPSADHKDYIVSLSPMEIRSFILSF